MRKAKPGPEPSPMDTSPEWTLSAKTSLPPNTSGSGTFDDFVRRILFEQSPDGIVVLDQDGGVYEANRRFAAMLGYRPAEVRLLHIWDWDCRWTEAELRQIIASVDPRGVMFETRHRRKDAVTILDVEVTVSGTVIEGRKYLLCIHRDITARKKTEAALRLTQFVMDRAPDSILLVDDAGRIVYANDSACASTGYTHTELMAMKVFDIDPDFSAEAYPAHKENLSRSGKMTFESRHRAKDGRIFPVEVTTNYLDYNGRFLGCAFDRDITERKQAEREREKLQALLFQAQKMESVGILAGGVAHDFNNILQAIAGQLEILRLKQTADHPDEKRLGAIEQSIQRAASLVRQLLLFSRQTEPAKQAVNLNHEIRETARILERTLPRMVSITLNLDSCAWPVNADPVQVEQVLLNLGANAADAMPEGGRLTLETRNKVLDSPLSPPLADLAPGRYVLMTVGDTGCGMDRKTLDHVFDPFFTTKEIGKGTGLGLASVYGIVKGHGGHISCYSERGRGTVFRIYWPALPEATGAGPSPDAAGATLRGGTETILVIDDEDEIRELTAEALRSQGFTVLIAADGEQGLELGRKGGRSIDLVILDLGMPGMGGYRCLKEWLKLDPQARVLVSSGYCSEEQAKLAMKRGAAGFIGKPYPLGDLLAKVREILDRGTGLHPG